MAPLRSTVLTAALISTGLVSSAGMALATTHDGGRTVQEGLVNSSDFAPNTTGDLCNNDVPVNAAGGQVPVQDIDLGLPVLSKAKAGNTASSDKSCSNGIAAHN